MKKKIIIIVSAVAAAALLLTSVIILTRKDEPQKKPKPSDNKANTEIRQDSPSEISEPDNTPGGSDDIPIKISDIIWDDEPGNGTDSGDYTPVFKIDDMFDGNVNTYWSPYKTETSAVEFSLKTEKTFNTLTFTEYRGYITDYIVEIKQSDEWVQIYRQDEMGKRTGVLDKTYTASEFRLTVTMSDERGGIAEMNVGLYGKVISADKFSNVGYYTASRLDKIRENNFSELNGLTDIIFFDFGSWDKNGNFLWGSMNTEYDEAFLRKMLEETDTALNGRSVRKWFCLQNYNKASTADTSELFASEESRKKLAEFAVKICEDYGFYGVDIDYEYPQFSKTNPDLAWSNYDKFLKTAADALHAKGYKLSTAFAPQGVKISAETVSKIDKVNIMAYDMLDSLGRHSSYALLNTSVVYFTELGFKKSQLVMGLPYYTKTTTNAGGQGWNWVINRWRNAVKPWTNSAYTNTYVFYFNGPYMIRDKVFYSMNNQLGGVFCWCMGTDIQSSDSRSLSRVASETIVRFSN